MISSDKFDRADSDSLGVDEQGHAWLVDAGQFAIVANKAHPRASFLTGPFRAYLDGVSESDVEVSVRTSNAIGSRLGVMLRYTDSRNYYLAQVTPDSYGISRKVSLVKVVDGVETNITSAFVLVPTVADLVFTADGAEFTVEVNGSLLIRATDTDLDGPGSCGLYFMPAAVPDSLNAGSYWDNWLVNSLSAAATKNLYPTSKEQTIYLRFESDEGGSALTFSVNQPGTEDVSDVLAQPLGGNVWRGSYQVNKQNAPAYVDGFARVRVQIDGIERPIFGFAAHPYLDSECGGPYFRIDTVGPLVVSSSVSVKRISERPFYADFAFNETLDEGMGAVVALHNAGGAVLMLPDWTQFLDEKTVRAHFTPPVPLDLEDGIYRLCIEDAFDCAGNPSNQWCRNVAIDTAPPRVVGFEVNPRVISAVAGCDITRITFSTDEPALDSMVVLVGGHVATRVFRSEDHQLWVWEYRATGSETEGPTDVVITTTDELGHTGTTTREDAVVFDFTAPTITFVKPANDGDTLEDQPLELAASWFDTNGVALDTVEILLDGEDITSQCVLSEDGFVFSRY